MTTLEATPTERVLTVPNALSALRIVVLPVFVWLALVRDQDGWAALLIGIAALSDNLDGYIARHYDQVSRLGQVLDPIVDRLVILTTLVVLVVSGALPWPWAAVVAAREVLLFTLLTTLRIRGFGSLPVNYVGKIGTFCLVFSMPFLLMGHGSNTATWLATLGTVTGWAAFAWGISLYWTAAALYLGQGVRLLRSGRPGPPDAGQPDTAPSRAGAPS